MRKINGLAMVALAAMITGCLAGRASAAVPAANAASEAVKEETGASGASGSSTKPFHSYTQLKKPVKLTWNCANGDVIITSVDTVGDRYKYYTDNGARMIIENPEGKKTFGFIMTGKAGAEYAEEAFRDGNEVLKVEERLIRMHIKDKTPDYYQLVYQIPGSGSVMVLMTEHSEEVLEEAFCIIYIDVMGAPNGDLFTREAEQDILGAMDIYTPEAEKPELDEYSMYLTFTITARFGKVVVMKDFAEATWYMEIPYGEADCLAGDEIEVVMDNTYGLDFESRTVTPIAIYRKGVRIFPEA